MHIFNRVKLDTPESVELEFILAGIGSRASALITDYLILGLSLLIVVLVWTVISALLLNNLGVMIFGSTFGYWIVGIAFFCMFATYAGYFVFFETFWQGQTPGKRMHKIRVVSDNGQPIGLKAAALRALLRPVDEFFFLGTYFILLSKQEKRLGDLAAGTIVVQDGSQIKSPNLNVSEQAKLFNLELGEFADLSRLLPDDFVIIREYLLRRKNLSPKARAKVSLNLAQQVQKIIYLEVLPANISADVFLESVYLAYQEPKF